MKPRSMPGNTMQVNGTLMPPSSSRGCHTAISAVLMASPAGRAAWSSSWPSPSPARRAAAMPIDGLAVGALDGPAGTAGTRLPAAGCEGLTAPRADALSMLHTGRAQRALVFERPSLNGREGFQEVGNEILVAVVAPGHALLQAATAPGGLGEAQLWQTRQIVVAGRGAGVVDPRVLLSQQLWRTDSPEVATGLLEAGQGWGWLPSSLVAAQLAAGTLCVLPLQGLTNALALCVDVVWSTERPMGLGARLLVEGVRRARA